MKRIVTWKNGSIVGPAKGILKQIIDIGDLPQDSKEKKTEHHFLIYMGLLMSFGGIIWGSMFLFYDIYIPSLIPYGYTVLTTINFVYFYYSKNFKLCRFVQRFNKDWRLNNLPISKFDPTRLVTVFWAFVSDILNTSLQAV